MSTITAARAPSRPAIALDANGADRGPAEVAAAAARAAQAGARVILFGPAEELRPAPAGVEIVDAPISIAKAADPARAVRTHPEASIVQAAQAVAQGRAAALVCAGATGAALAAGLFHIRRAQGIHRPALALPIPVPGRPLPVVLIDVGANADARAEHLVQFAFMGAAFATHVLGVRRPRVALLANGSERERGSALVLASSERLRERAQSSAGLPFTFAGNVEGDSLFAGAVDVAVCDGFTGNVALKVAEGVADRLMGALRDAALSSARGRLGGALLRSQLLALRSELDAEAQGGAYLLGLRAPIVIAHGRFSQVGLAAAVARAEAAVREDVCGRTHGALAAAEALRRHPEQAGAAQAQVAEEVAASATPAPSAPSVIREAR